MDVFLEKNDVSLSLEKKWLIAVVSSDKTAFQVKTRSLRACTHHREGMGFWHIEAALTPHNSVQQ